MTEKRKVVRYHTESKELAFKFMSEKNKISPKWRVAAKIRNRLIFDIDVDDLPNVQSIKGYYEKLTGTILRAFRTNNGYHLISEKYDDILQCQYDQCRALYPFLKMSEIEKYEEKLRAWYEKVLLDEHKQKIDRQKFLDYLPMEFSKSGLDAHVGNFDILFAFNVIWKGYYCIRISKKHEGDNPYEVKL